MMEQRQKTKRKIYLATALLAALVVTSGTFVYTYTEATTTGDVETVPAIATVVESADHPDWNSVLPTSGGRTEILRPDSTGDVTNISYQEPSSGDHWDKVADATPDDWSTYVYTDSKSFQRDLYNIPDHSAGSGNIDSVAVYFRFATDDDSKKTDMARARALIKTHDSVFEGTVERVDDSTFITRAYQWTVNPYTREAWTWDEIDNLQIGVAIRVVDKKGNACCTQVFVAVDYTIEAITEGEVPTGDLFDITTHGQYTGDLGVTVYLLNTGSLIKAYNYLNIKLELEDSVEGTYLPLTFNNGVATFKLEGSPGATRTLSVTGGSYSLVSGDPAEWQPGWSIIPELHCEITQR